MRHAAWIVAGLLIATPVVAEAQPAPGQEVKIGQEPKDADGAALPGTASGESPAPKDSTPETRTPGCDSLNDPVMRIRCVQGKDYVP